MSVVPPSTALEWHEFLRAYSAEFRDSTFMRRMAGQTDSATRTSAS
ncbi:hypothetical protein [Nocardia aurantia]|uniref:Uncharacterized protein n=1 Tax=Nocardia aurantia TaxID=2585199 RepID=A0A7K0DSU0_9NOCA|nr:hypothetical protein [Nocardia aurantia]MQY28796.1 hypothetical protein [Nocardia aurantia]